MTKVTRAEHLAWCKTRALEYVDSGDISGALASMTSDLNKHPETQDHPATTLGLILSMGGHLKTKEQMKNHIEGFN